MPFFVAYSLDRGAGSNLYADRGDAEGKVRFREGECANRRKTRYGDERRPHCCHTGHGQELSAIHRGSPQVLIFKD